MFRITGFLLGIVFFLSCHTKSTKDGVGDPEVKKGRYEELFKEFVHDDNTLYVVNFWATWCVPCVKELPDFMEVNEKYKDQSNFKMILVSLDRAKDFESKVMPFIKEQNIAADVYLLDDNKRMNDWIPKVNSRWSGAIPATAFYKNGKQLDFVEHSLTRENLEQRIKNYL